MRTTISDIAAYLNVSANTVSKALNGKSKISEPLRAKIIATAKEMNYIPNRSAKHLVGREYHIAVVYPVAPVEFYEYWEIGIRQAERELLDSKCVVHYYPCPYVTSCENYRESLTDILSNRFDGVVIINSYENINYRDELEVLAAQNIPVLYSIINSNYQYPYIGHVKPEAILGGKVAAEFLAFATQGLSNKIAVFAGHVDSDLHSDCIAGFHEYAKKFGLKECFLGETAEDKQTAYRLTDKLLSEQPDVSGIYVTSYNSVGVCEWIENHDMTKKIKVIGYDLYPALNDKLLNRSLTATLFQNQSELGRQSLLLMFDYLNGVRKAEQCALNVPIQLLFGSMISQFPTYM